MVNTLVSHEVSLEPIHIKLLRARHTRYISHLIFSLTALFMLSGMPGIVGTQDVHIQDAQMISHFFMGKDEYTTWPMDLEVFGMQVKRV